MERGNNFFLTELLFLTVKLSCDALFWLPVMLFISHFFSNMAMKQHIQRTREPSEVNGAYQDLAHHHPGPHIPGLHIPENHSTIEHHNTEFISIYKEEELEHIITSQTGKHVALFHQDKPKLRAKFWFPWMLKQGLSVRCKSILLWTRWLSGPISIYMDFKKHTLMSMEHLLRTLSFTGLVSGKKTGEVPSQTSHTPPPWLDKNNGNSSPVTEDISPYQMPWISFSHSDLPSLGLNVYHNTTTPLLCSYSAVFSVPPHAPKFCLLNDHNLYHHFLPLWLESEVPASPNHPVIPTLSSFKCIPGSYLKADLLSSNQLLYYRYSQWKEKLLLTEGMQWDMYPYTLYYLPVLWSFPSHLPSQFWSKSSWMSQWSLAGYVRLQ